MFTYVTLNPSFQNNHPAWWSRMLPKTSRCILGLEDAPADDGRGERGAVVEGGSQTDRRNRRRYAAMWEGASALFERFGESEQHAPPPPPPRRNFDANACIQLLNVLPRDSEARLRRSALDRLRTFMDEDQAADEAADGAAESPRRRSPRGRSPRTLPRRRGHSTSSESGSSSSSSSSSSGDDGSSST
jgi:hypothetical protein